MTYTTTVMLPAIVSACKFWPISEVRLDCSGDMLDAFEAPHPNYKLGCELNVTQFASCTPSYSARISIVFQRVCVCARAIPFEARRTGTHTRMHAFVVQSSSAAGERRERRTVNTSRLYVSCRLRAWPVNISRKCVGAIRRHTHTHTQTHTQRCRPQFHIM